MEHASALSPPATHIIYVTGEKMPYTSLSKAKQAGAIVTFRKKPISLSAVNKLYSIYDAIKSNGKKTVNPMAVAMSTWKTTVVLKNGVWTLKPQKKESKRKAESISGGYGYPMPAGGVTSLPMPAGSAKMGDGSMETFKDMLRDALRALFGEKQYVYIISTYRTKVVVDVESNGGKATGYYEVPYTIKKGSFNFGTPVKVVRLTKFQKAEQKRRKEKI